MCIVIYICSTHTMCGLYPVSPLNIYSTSPFFSLFISLSSSTTSPPSMAAGISAASSSTSFSLGRNPFLGPNPIWLFAPSVRKLNPSLRFKQKSLTTVCFVVEPRNDSSGKSENNADRDEVSREEIEAGSCSVRVEERRARKKSERFTYLVAAVMSSLGITSMAVLAVYYRFSWQMEVYTCLLVPADSKKLFNFVISSLVSGLIIVQILFLNEHCY